MTRSQHRRIGLFAVASLTLCMACTIGAGEDDDSAISSAFITVANRIGVADGVDRIELTVAGPEGLQLTLEVAGTGARFAVANDEPANGTEKTVVLSGGTATAELLAVSAGEKRVVFKLDPLNSVKDVTFKQVEIEAGTPTAFRHAPGAVVHSLCVGLNTAVGVLKTETAGITPAQANVTDQQPSVGNCPANAVGYARFDWTATTTEAAVEFSYHGPGDAELRKTTVDLNGSAFPGYDVTAMPPVVNGTYISVVVDVKYRAGSLSAGPAALVDVVQRLVPLKPGPTFLGSSFGDAMATPKTDVDGKLELFYSNSPAGTFALFLTPVGGGAVHAGDLVITGGSP